jgi:hypothetical protein
MRPIAFFISFSSPEISFFRIQVLGNDRLRIRTSIIIVSLRIFWQSQCTVSLKPLLSKRHPAKILLYRNVSRAAPLAGGCGGGGPGLGMEPFSKEDRPWLSPSEDPVSPSLKQGFLFPRLDDAYPVPAETGRLDNLES